MNLSGRVVVCLAMLVVAGWLSLSLAQHYASPALAHEIGQDEVDKAIDDWKSDDPEVRDAATEKLGMEALESHDKTLKNLRLIVKRLIEKGLASENEEVKNRSEVLLGIIPSNQAITIQERILCTELDGSFDFELRFLAFDPDKISEITVKINFADGSTQTSSHMSEPPSDTERLTQKLQNLGSKPTKIEIRVKDVNGNVVGKDPEFSCVKPPPDDEDSDGVPDVLDLCLGTQVGVEVDSDGCPLAVGGTVQVLTGASDAPAQPAGIFGAPVPYAAGAGGAAAVVVAVAAGGWYARRRWLR